ncbi:hypothetical protein ACGFOU_00870 [Streptomyces sp. NPDC048595]|uniref:hypothetical protein n=1 Tax=Streptomyces sp. NPDC048595 TaxID=3365576 RepID=UPI00371447EC
MYEHSSTHPADSTTPTDRTAAGGGDTGGGRSPFRRTVLGRVLPAVAAAGIGVAGFAGLAHGSDGKTAKVGDWYLSDKLAELKTDTGH